ncbi:MAG: AraC family transcriptional regulator [Oscillospiraceae bacterium]|nr:AraC family transcriptional regulator [Oscillospiraceae bacterium]
MLIHADSVDLIDCGQEKTVKKRFISEELNHYLIILSNSRMLVRLNKKQYYMPPFTFMIVPFQTKELFLQLRNITIYRYLHLHCTEEYLQKFSKHHLNFSEVYTLAQPLVFEELWKLLQESIYSSKICHATETGQYTLHLLLCLLMEGSNGTVTPASEVPHYNKLTFLRSRIYRFPAQNWSIQEICDNLGISKPYFHKIYLLAFGTTCTQDVITSRIACAKKLLTTTNHTITVISQKCGFETDVYFMRQFKRRVGMTPTTYRHVCEQSSILQKSEKKGDILS